MTAQNKNLQIGVSTTRYSLFSLKRVANNVIRFPNITAITKKEQFDYFKELKGNEY